jgi:hypothetical protein
MPDCESHPVMIYGQLITQEQPGKLLTLSTRMWLGAERLTQLGLPLSTALNDRLNLTMCHALGPLVNTTGSVCKDREPTPHRVVFVRAFYKVARLHRSLPVLWPDGTPPAAGMIPPQWQRCIPGMAACFTDQSWTFRELLTVKCEPLDSQSISG